MPLWPTSTRVLLALAALAGLLLFGCSSSTRRDQWYGTDAAVGFVPPDVGPRADTKPDTKPDTSDVAVDQATVPDGVSAVDGSADISVEMSDDSSSEEGG
jgi:hypothetical protein